MVMPNEREAHSIAVEMYAMSRAVIEQSTRTPA